ncbi:MAG: BsaWI family type II restriction enzyme [bacterium]|nr:BsaWI family type II restriction enzyme [bacterium]
MSDPKQKVLKIIQQIEKGEINPKEGWNEIKKLKDEYVTILTTHYPHLRSAEQSWHSFIGNKFERIVGSIIKAYVREVKENDEALKGLAVLTKDEIKKKKNEVIFRKLAVKYEKYLLLPDADLVIVDFNTDNTWKSTVIAIISCKTSLRERIAQACYWKLKLLSSNVTKNIKIFLATVDHDEDFDIDFTKRGRIDGKSRDRIISEYELDGVYILREDFKEEWGSEKIKRYERIFQDFSDIFKKRT